jgi:predicted phosphoribosyltransferase
MKFENRGSAGRILGEQLAGIVQGPCIVAGIPRGGVLVALSVSQSLGAVLTVVHAHRLVSPWAPEITFGAVDEDGGRLVDRATAAALELSDHDIEKTLAHERWRITQRARAYAAPPLWTYVPGLPVVLVDDGMATGLTMMAAINHARRHAADRVIAAVPCASAHAAQMVRGMVERFVCPLVVDEVESIDRFYRNYHAVSDEDVSRALARHLLHPHGPDGATSMRRIHPVR